MKNSKRDVIKAHEHSIYNKTELEASEKCGCFYCLSIFSPSEINEYIDEEPDETAICPFCFVDSVIGDRSGYPITEEFLKRMKQCWM